MARPESLKVLETGEQADNILEGTAIDVIMLGGVSRFFVRLDCGEVVSGKSLTLAEGPRIDRGHRVRVGWSAADAVLLTRGTTRKVP